MAQLLEIKVPDVGNYKNIPVIELLVKVGDSVVKDQGLLTLESDKATMEVPSSAAGVVKELRVKIGDEVSEGAVVAVLEVESAGASPAAAPAKVEIAKPTAAPAPQHAPVASASAPAAAPVNALQAAASS